MDRISNLADEILCHIISFLPTKDAVCTPILSTRWRYLFALVPNLEFNCNAEWQTPDAFMNFVDRVLLLRKRKSIDRFALYLSKSVDPFRVDGWIRAVLCHSVVELVLFSLNMQIGLPASLFTCKTLVVLKLRMLDSLRVPAKVYIPSLKVFDVDSCRFEDDDFGEFLSIGCPVLEELVVKSHFNGIECKVNVSSASLKRLSLRAGCATKKTGFPGIVEIIINAPSLVYLQYSGFFDNSIALIRVPSLTEARIDYYKIGRTEAIRTEAIRLLEGIRNIQSLYISSGNIYELLEESVSLPLFHNLTYLEVSVRVMKYFLALDHLLQYSNFLETLVMKELPYTVKTDNGFELENRRVPRPFLSCLKAIEILSFKGYEAQKQIVKYFLKNAKALENMTIHIRGEERHQLKITKELLMFPRVSRKCQVRIV